MQDKLTETSTRPNVSLHQESPAKKSSGGRIFLWLLILAAIGAGGWYFWRSQQAGQTTAAAQTGGGGGGRRGGGGQGGGGPVPVVVAAAVRQDLPVYLDGLGAVSAFNTVTVKSRVDGELAEIHFQEGQDVKKGDLLAVIDPRPYQVALAQAQANLAKDQAQLADAKLNADRYVQLAKEGVIPQQQSDTQGALANQLLAAVQADQAQIDSAKLNIVYSNITSPIDGRVGLRLVDQGNIVHASDAGGLLVITQLQPIAVIFTLPEDSLTQVAAGMRRATLPVKAMSRDNGTELASGTLLTIDNEIDPTTGTFRIKAVFDNKDRTLWPNEFVNARLLLDTKRNATTIPSVAVQTGSQGTFVYALKPDGTVEVRPVSVDITEGTTSSISSGLAAGDQVVTDGQDRLRAGIQVDARTDSGGKANAAASTMAPASPNDGSGKKKREQMGQAGNQSGAASDGSGAQGFGKHGPGGSYGGNGGQGSQQGFANGGQYTKPKS